MPLESGSTLQNRYIIDRVLGRGGMGCVYLARHAALGDKLLAIKELLLPERGTTDHEKCVQQFNREAKLMAMLDHPCLVNVSDFFEEGHHHYLVMSYVDGRTLQEWLDASSTPLDRSMVLDWMDSICAVLTYLHSHAPPIIYRDLKPSNIMVDSKQRIRLLDFGIARVVEQDQSTNTVIRGVGTVGFSPPEQYTSASTDARSDIYALGATLYYLLTGQVPPFSLDIMMGEQRLAPPSSLNPGIGFGLEAVLLKMMALTRDQRYADAEEVRQALRAVREEPPARYVDPASLPQHQAPADTVRPAAVPHPSPELKLVRRVPPPIRIPEPPPPSPPIHKPEPPPPAPVATPPPPQPRPLEVEAPPPPWVQRGAAEEPTTIVNIETVPPFSLMKWCEEHSWLLALAVTLVAAYDLVPQYLSPYSLGPLAFLNLLVYRLGTLLFFYTRDPFMTAVGGLLAQLAVPLVGAVVLQVMQLPVGAALAFFWVGEGLLEGAAYLHSTSFASASLRQMHADWVLVATRVGVSEESLHNLGFGLTLLSLMALVYLLIAGMPSQAKRKP